MKKPLLHTTVVCLGALLLAGAVGSVTVKAADATTQTLRRLPIGGEVCDSLVADGDSDLLYVETTGGEHLIFQLDAVNYLDDNELYVKHGSVPTRTDYDFAATAPSRSDQYLEVPFARPGTYYVLVFAADDFSTLDDDGYCLRVDTDSTLPTLGVAVASIGALAADHDFDLYRFEARAGEHLIFQLDASNYLDHNELYVRFGALPTRTVYDFAAADPSRSDQYLETPIAAAGTYYVLVYAVDDFSTLDDDGYSLQVDTDATLPTLRTGEPLRGTLAADYDFDLYRYEAPSGEHLIFQLDAFNYLDDNELYVRFGALPTRTAYDFAATAPSRSDQYLEAPLARAGVYYVLVHAADDFSTLDDDGYSLRVDTDVTLPTLKKGEVLTGSLVADYDFDLYRFQARAGEHLVIQLDGVNHLDDNELYVRCGALPTPTEYDFAANQPGQSDQYIEIPTAQGGVYYVLVHAADDFSTLDDDGYSLWVDGLGVIGDVNDDGSVDIRDVQRMFNIILTIPPPPTGGEITRGDLNGNGVIDIEDVQAVINIVLGRPSGS